MPVAERLRALHGPAPDVDLDRSLGEVRRRARAHRRRRTAMTGLLAAVAVGAVAVGASLGSVDDTSIVDTVDSTDEHVRVLPGRVPEGFRLAWVDTPAGRSGDAQLPLWEQAFDYAYGYQSETAELQVNVHVGERLEDPSAIAAEWGETLSVTSVGGRPALRWTDGAHTRVVLEADGTVIHVVTHPLGSYPEGDNPDIPAPEVVDRFATSVRRVGDDDWQSALSQGVDVASTFGPKDGRPVISGDRWSLMAGTFRAPVSVRHPSFWIDFDGTTSAALPPEPATEGTSLAELAVHNGIRVAWGVLPPRARTVTVTIGQSTFTADTEPIARARIFALDVSDTDGTGMFYAVDRDGNHVGSGPVDTE